MTEDLWNKICRKIEELDNTDKINIYVNGENVSKDLLIYTSKDKDRMTIFCGSRASLTIINEDKYIWVMWKSCSSKKKGVGITHSRQYIWNHIKYCKTLSCVYDNLFYYGFMFTFEEESEAGHDN